MANVLKKIEIQQSLSSLSLGKCTGKLLAGADSNGVRVWNIREGTVKVLSGLSEISSVELHKYASSTGDEDLLACGNHSGTIRIWDLHVCQAVRTFSEHKASISSLAFHPLSEILISASLDSTVKVWDLRSKNCVHTFETNEPVSLVKCSPDGTWLVTCSQTSNTFKLWSLKSYTLLHSFTAHQSPITSVAFHPTKFRLATASENQISVWDLEKFAQIGKAQCNSKIVRIAFNSTGKSLQVASIDAFQIYNSCKKMILVASTNVEQFVDMLVLPSSIALGISTNANNCLTVWFLKLADHTKWPRYQEKTSEKTASDRTQKENLAVQLNSTIDTDALADSLLASHAQTFAVLNQRLTELTRVKSVWSKGDIMAAFEAVKRTSDPAATLSDILTRADLDSIPSDALPLLLPLLHDALASTHEEFVTAALKALGQLALNHWAAIKVAKRDPLQSRSFDAFSRIRDALPSTHESPIVLAAAQRVRSALS